ncbi:hypothetical protein [uncultured Chryseobacterium sp.]|uniref:hypothetical protein n=1 Tax=uncultured Chryseobacterium sp. TaxID=259322 RepID=UPI00260073FD|nr:hypothetical protein [uncultured Chryseobacterium sp.]
MNIKKIFGQRNEIIEGHLNELRSKIGLADQKEEYIYAVREEICNVCPLKNGNNCDTQKWINPRTMEVASAPKEGFIRGCGCRLSAKQKSKSSLCPAGFWGGEFN